MDHLQSELPDPYRADSIIIENYSVTSKNKGVMTGFIGKRSIVIKLPFNAAAIVEEEQNASTLRELAGAEGSKLAYFPRSLAQGQLNNLNYYVEERVTGRPLRECLQAEGRTAYLRQVEKVLEDLNPAPGRLKHVLIDDLYQVEVGRYLQAVFQVTPDQKMQESLKSFFFGELYGNTITVGRLHNDLSVSNIYIHNGRIAGLIDWGASSASGVPLMDTFNYLDSVQRACHQEVSLAQSIGLLASGRWPVREERDFLDRQYERNGIGEKSQVAFVYLYWLQHVATALSYRLSFDVPGIQKDIVGVIEELLTMKPTLSRGNPF